MSLVAKNKKIGGSIYTAYYYSDGSGKLKFPNGKEATKFYVTQSGKVNALNPVFDRTKVMEYVQNDCSKLVESGKMYPV